MNKLEKKLSAGKKEALSQRAQIVSEDIHSEIESVITSLEKKRRELTKNKLNHTDIGPANTTSLRVVDGNFDSAKWVEDLFNIEKELLNNEIELRVINNIKNEWLTDADDEK